MVGKKRRIAPEEKIARTFKDHIRRVAEREGMKPEELEARLKEFFSRAPQAREMPSPDTSKVGQARSRVLLKVTTSINDPGMVVKFMKLKERYNAKSNSAVFRRLLEES